MQESKMHDLRQSPSHEPFKRYFQAHGINLNADQLAKHFDSPEGNKLLALICATWPDKYLAVGREYQFLQEEESTKAAESKGTGDAGATTEI